MGRIFKASNSAKTGTPLAQHIGRQILALRQKHRVTLRDVSAGTGVSNAFVCQLENGQSSPSADTLLALAEFFDVSPGFFFEGFR